MAPIAEPFVLRHRRALLAGAVLLAAAVVAAVVVALSGESNRHAPVAVLPDSVAVIDTKTNGVAGDVALGSTPTWIAYGDGAVWASETDSSQIARIDARTLALATKGLPGLPGEAVVGTADVFVNEFQGARIFELSPATGEFVDSISVVHGRVSREFGLGGIAIGGGRLWVGNSADSTLVEIDPDAATILKRTPTPGETGALWATTLQQDVLRIESDTDRVSSTIPVTNSPNGVAVARDTVWVADGPKAIAIDAGTGVVKQTVAIGTPTSPLGTGFGQGVQGIVVAGNDVWVTDPIGGRVLRVGGSGWRSTRDFGTRSRGKAVPAMSQGQSLGHGRARRAG